MTRAEETNDPDLDAMPGHVGSGHASPVHAGSDGAGPRGPDSAGGDLDDTALRFVVTLHRLVRGLRRAQPVTGLQPTQVLILAQLAEAGPMRIGELAARVPCAQPTATTVANGLEGAGLVRRVPDTEDGRAIRLQLTETGRTTLLEVARGQAVALRARLAELAVPDLDLVLAALPVLQRMAAPPGESGRPIEAVAGDDVSGGAAAGSAGRSRTTGS